jgi:esterase
MTVDLAYQAYGEGSPIVVLHGLLGSARNWTTVARRLAESYRVYALDLRNHGGSPWADEMTYEAMADDVSAFMAREDLGPSTLIGHSMGGKVAMHLALGQPEQIARLIVVDIAPVAYDHSFEHYVDAMRGIDLSRVSRRADVERELHRTIDDVVVANFLLQNLVRGEQGLVWRANLDALSAHDDAILGFPDPGERRYPGPTLFMLGEHSHYVRREHRRPIKRMFPEALIMTIRGAGHWVHAERTDEFLATVRAFLR